MNKAIMQKTILFFILMCACTCVGCHVQQSEVGEEEIGHTEIFQNTKTDQEEPDATDADQEESDDTDTEQAEESSENPASKDPKNAKLLCLESGDMETLPGISGGRWCCRWRGDTMGKDRIV